MRGIFKLADENAVVRFFFKTDVDFAISLPRLRIYDLHSHYALDAST